MFACHERGSVATDRVVLAGGYWSERFLANLGVRLPQSGVISSVMRTSPVELGHQRTFCAGAFAVRKRLDGGYTHCQQRLFGGGADTEPSALCLMTFCRCWRMNWRDVKLRLGRRLLDEALMRRTWRLDEVTPFEAVRILDPKPYASLFEVSRTGAAGGLSDFPGPARGRKLGRHDDATPDAVPVIDAVKQYPGLFLARVFRAWLWPWPGGPAS